MAARRSPLACGLAFCTPIVNASAPLRHVRAECTARISGLLTL
jgi:hypothetical protein